MAGGVKWIIANWKSNKSFEDSLEWINQVGAALKDKDLSSVHVVVCPSPFVLGELSHEIEVNNYPVFLGAQNISPFGMGAYTGELSAEQLKGELELTLIGHSERRQHFGETDEMVAEKVKQARANAMKAVVCVQGVETPIPEGTDVVAYEPVSAIGSGNPDTPEHADEVAKEIKEKFSGPVLYGGSVTTENVKQLIDQPNIDGVLVGGASLDPKEFITIIEQCLI